MHNAPLLVRAPRLSADIAFFLQVPESCWQGHPIHTALVMCHAPPLERYVHRLRELANGSDPSPLLAHAYVRYFGDLSGGQILRRTLARAYNLEAETEDRTRAGLSFYEFTVLGGDRRKLATPAQVNQIKEWFRTGIDRGTMDDPDLKCVHPRGLFFFFFFFTYAYVLFCSQPLSYVKHSPLLICPIASLDSSRLFPCH
jgi:heme oxygenase (biliverdin-producing, ferredoxin)